MKGWKRGVDSLLAEMDESYSFLVEGVEGLTDEEFFWQPVPDCWSVFCGPNGRWTYHYEEPDPVPSPVTTIGWRLVHIALCKVIYHEWAFGPAKLDFVTIDNPHDTASAKAMLERGHSLLRSDLVSTGEEGLASEVLTNWGEAWPAWRIFRTMIQHDDRHGAEIRLLRDLFRSRD